MNEKQKESLMNHVAWHKPIPRLTKDGEVYFLDNGMTVEFTLSESYSGNSKFQINDDKYRYIWFNQLSNLFFYDDLTPHVAEIVNKSGERKQICSYSHIDFWNEVKGKKYRVDVSGPFYVINRYSNTAKEKGLYSYQEIYSYVKACVENNKISDIGDCLNTASKYNLTEI